MTGTILSSLTILPSAAAADPALSSGTLRVLIACPSVTWQPIRARELAAQLHLSVSTVYRALRTLRRLHYLLVMEPAVTDHTRTLYRVNLLRAVERSAS